MRPAFLGAMGWVLLLAAGYASSFGWLEPRKLRDAWRGPGALTGPLSESLACDLVSDFVRETEAVKKVECDGPLVSSLDVATLEDTRIGGQRRTWCLARAPTWKVVRQKRGIPCFPTPPPDPSRLRDSERERVMEWAQARLTARLEAIRTAMLNQERPRKCPPGKISEAGEVPLLEYELLSGADDARWAFLSTTWLRDPVRTSTPASAVAAMERWGALRPWVAVVASSTREEAEAGTVGRARGWTRGKLTGTITLIDTETATVRCEAPFSFESSPTLAAPTLPSRSGSRLSPLMEPQITPERVRTDFEAQYRAATSTALNEMTTWDAWPVSQ